ncbi:hypothetical protein QBC39DRAFT_362530 [Podospora conica]|nr:hypothetical protein QBC39DRAFT_362530 [Schizothecium conicum]
MGYHRLTQLQAYPHDLEGGAIYRRVPRQHLFTRTELAVLVPLTALATGLGVFTVVYIVHQRNTIQPGVIAALGGTSLLLLAVVFLVFRRLRRPALSRDMRPRAENSMRQAWTPIPTTATAPVPYHSTMQVPTTGPTELYAAVPVSKSPSPTPSTFGSRLRLAIENSVSAGRLSRGSFDSTSTSTAHEDRELLLLSDSSRTSVDSSEAREGHGLWHSVFELPGDDKLEKLRQKNLKRLSKESRRSRQEMTEFDRPISGGDSSPRIVVTRPQATASRSGDSRLSSTPSSEEVSLRETSLKFDPLRANPVQIKRDPSMRQTRSSHDLAGLIKNDTSYPFPAVRRPRSAEPGPDRCRLGHESTDSSPRREIPPVVSPKPVSPPSSERERRPTPRGTSEALGSMPVSPLTPGQELKTYPVLREATAGVGVSPVSPLSFAERMAQRENGRRRAASPSAGSDKGARDLRAAYMNRI